MFNMLIGNLFLFLNLFHFANQTLQLKFSYKEVFAYMILDVLILYTRSYPNVQLFGTLLMFLFYFVFIFYFFIGTKLKKMLVLVIFILIISISELLTANTLNLLLNLEATDVNTYLYLIALVLSNILTYILLNPIAKFIQLNSKYKFDRKFFLILVLPISTFLLFLSLGDYFETYQINFLIIPTVIGLLIANYITIYVFFQSLKAIELRDEINRMQIQHETINNIRNDNMKFLHDIIWKLSAIYNEAQKGHNSDINEYINDLSNYILKKYNIINTNSSLISSYLSYRIGDIIENNIQVSTNIMYNDFSSLGNEIGNELFYILINNAVDSCIFCRTQDKIIYIKTDFIDNKGIIRLCYTFSQEYQEKNNIVMNKIRDKLLDNLYDMKDNYKKDYCDLIIILK